MIPRRLVLMAAGLVLALGPLAAAAQPVPRIGLLGDTPWEPLRQGLRELGYVDGKNILFEDRRAGGRIERWPDLAAELVRLRVQVIVTSGTPAALAAKRVTTTIPIVMAVTGDPESTGLVASLAQPGGNVTGLMQLGAGLAAKRLELLREVVPNLARVAFLWNPANLDQRSHFTEAQSGARSLGLTLQSVEVRTIDQLESAFATMMRDRPSALLMTADSVHQLRIDWIIAFASKNRLPVMYQLPDNVERGGLMAYGAVRDDLVRRAAMYVDKILKGARPADLPVEQPSKFELAVNLKTARALGLTVPQSLLLRADQVVE
ncbi:MAG TPA: ABC transporter substrate-binding protein [Methylomirabilota bacterium]|nr:ABC transporter substrate-binding protein [Methylomirabilota bacterium]